MHVYSVDTRVVQFVLYFFHPGNIPQLFLQARFYRWLLIDAGGLFTSPEWRHNKIEAVTRADAVLQRKREVP